MKPKQALVLRLYTDPKLYEIARLVGYQGVAVEGEVRTKLEELAKQYGRAAMQEAAEDLVTVNSAMSPPFARLKPSVVPLCFQLLGPVPEQEAAFYRNADGTENWPDWKSRPIREEPQPEPKPKRPRKKAS